MVKKINLLACVIVYYGVAGSVTMAQSTGEAVAKKVGVYVYPAKGQTQDQQDKDESYCYTWAVQQSGFDPINPTTVQAQQVKTGPDGSVVVGAAKGAAAGAAIGAVTHNAGHGAAIGSISGAILGHHKRRSGQAMAQAGSDMMAGQQNQNLVDGFKKAFSACLEGKGYTVN
jgi:hypothetical protein